MIRSIITILAAVFILSACDNPFSEPETLTVLAGSEIKDLKPWFEKIEKETDIRLEMSYVGTLDGAEQIINGEKVDLAWFSHAKYLTLLQAQNKRIHAQEKIMLSPVVLGVKRSKAREWGWENNPDITWKVIAEKAGSGELRYAMTNPASSNSGFTSLVGVAAALSDKGEIFTPQDINLEAMKTFFKGQKLTAGSSGWLADTYINEQDRLDGIINYESVLIQLNKSGKLKDPLVLIYPKEGIITADYPLMLINPDKRETYQKLRDYLRSPEFQTTLMNGTSRRPVLPQIRLNSDFSDQLLVELPFPSRLDVINDIIYSYLDEQRMPSYSIFVLDLSGSMEGERLNALEHALKNLTGLDRSMSGLFARFRERETIVLLTFNHNIIDTQSFNIGRGEKREQQMNQIRYTIERFKANGKTAIFDALVRACKLAENARKNDPDRYYSIVLMSDGKSNAGMGLNQFMRYYRQVEQRSGQIKTFPIIFGETDQAAMKQIAEASGGRMFDGNHESLADVFKKIRGYQ